jgi:hypothetical protein
VSAATGYENTICRGYRIQGDTPIIELSAGPEKSSQSFGGLGDS